MNFWVFWRKFKSFNWKSDSFSVFLGEGVSSWMKYSSVIFYDWEWMVFSVRVMFERRRFETFMKVREGREEPFRRAGKSLVYRWIWFYDKFRFSMFKVEKSTRFRNSVPCSE